MSNIKFGNNSIQNLYVGLNFAKAYIGDSVVFANAEPGPVDNLNATPINEAVILGWTAPNMDGIGPPINDYIIEYSTDESNWTTASDGTNTNTNYTVTGLTNTTLYYFRVYAVNDRGTSSATATSATPDIFPPASPNVSVTSVGDGSITIEWNEPDGYGLTIESYEIDISTDDISYSNVETNYTGPRSYTFNSLTNGTTYYFRVSANSDGGTGNPGGTNGIPGRIPDDITDLTATPIGDNSNINNYIDLSWTLPNDNGSSLSLTLQYKISSESEWTSIAVDNDDTTATFDDTDGTNYDFRIRASNSFGDAANWDEANATIPLGGCTDDAADNYDPNATFSFGSCSYTPTPPDAISDLSAVASENTGQIDLSWSPPGAGYKEDGPDSIQGYDLEYFLTSEMVWNSVSPGPNAGDSTYSVTGLNSSISTYQFRLRANNTNYSADWSNVTDGVVAP